MTALTSSARANKLFKQAWASSPSAHFPGLDLIDYERANADYGKSLGSNCDQACLKGLDEKKLIDSIPAAWKNDVSASLPTVGEEKGHEFLIVDGGIIKKHPQDVWKKDLKLASKLVIGTTAHVAFDPLKPARFNVNMTAEEVRKYVSESQIGSANLTEEAIKLYGDSVQGLIKMISGEISDSLLDFYAN